MMNTNVSTMIRLLILYLLRESIDDNSKASYYQTNVSRFQIFNRFRINLNKGSKFNLIT